MAVRCDATASWSVGSPAFAVAGGARNAVFVVDGEPAECRTGDWGFGLLFSDAGGRVVETEDCGLGSLLSNSLFNKLLVSGLWSKNEQLTSRLPKQLHSPPDEPFPTAV